MMSAAVHSCPASCWAPQRCTRPVLVLLNKVGSTAELRASAAGRHQAAQAKAGRDAASAQASAQAAQQAVAGLLAAAALPDQAPQLVRPGLPLACRLLQAPCVAVDSSHW